MVDEIKLNVVGEEDHSHETTEKHEDTAAKTTAQKPKTDEIKVKLGFLKKTVFWQFLSVLFIILFIVSLFFVWGGGGITKTEARNKVQGYVDAVIAGRVVATVGEAIAEGDLYRIPISISGQDIDSYMTKDGRLFFPSGVDIDKVLENPLPTLDIGDEQVAENGAQIDDELADDEDSSADAEE